VKKKMSAGCKMLHPYLKETVVVIAKYPSKNQINYGVQLSIIAVNRAED
jgi:hypothetical protein